MAIPQRKPAQSPATNELRAKSLKPFERSRQGVRAETEQALRAFERAVVAYEVNTRDDAAWMRVRVAAARAMDELRNDWLWDRLPSDLAAEIERWDEGQFSGTRADVELASWALVELLGSDVRIGEPAAADVE